MGRPKTLCCFPYTDVRKAREKFIAKERNLQQEFQFFWLFLGLVSSGEGCMGWLQLVGSIKLQVSFAKETYKRDDILQKRPIILSILLTVATPYLPA